MGRKISEERREERVRRITSLARMVIVLADKLEHDQDLCYSLTGTGIRVAPMYLRYGLMEVIKMTDELASWKNTADLFKTGEEDAQDLIKLVFGEEPPEGLSALPEEMRDRIANSDECKAFQKMWSGILKEEDEEMERKAHEDH